MRSICEQRVVSFVIRLLIFAGDVERDDDRVADLAADAQRAHAHDVEHGPEGVTPGFVRGGDAVSRPVEDARDAVPVVGRQQRVHREVLHLAALTAVLDPVDVMIVNRVDDHHRDRRLGQQGRANLRELFLRQHRIFGAGPYPIERDVGNGPSPHRTANACGA